MSQTAQKKLSPGVYPDIPNAAYHAANAFGLRHGSRPGTRGNMTKGNTAHI